MINENDAPRIAAEVVARVYERCRARAARPGGKPLDEIINETLYHERRRLARQRGRDEERAFYSGLRHRLGRASEAETQRMLHEIITRYVEEISGHFDPNIYRVATRVMPVGVSALLTGLSPGRLLGSGLLGGGLLGGGPLPSLEQMLEIHGDVETTRRLNELGTVLYVPTHSSNLDSIILGLALYQAGLPPVTYGAGLNLFENRIIGYFMQNLGAYTVDRLKTDPLYRDALKEYSTVVLEYGRPSLFFPGGTRARAGTLETYLKKGLLGTAVAAYRNNLERNRDRRIFVVPVTLNYPLVLEAATLIDDHLQISGQSRYIIVDDEFSQLDRWVAYARGLFALDMHIYVRFGAPLDPFGNPVNEQGESLDPHGRVIDPGRYLMDEGAIVDDETRDAEYTRMLARGVVRSFFANNIACATHVVSFAMLHALYERERPSHLYRFLRSLGPETSLPVDQLLATLQRLLDELGALADDGGIQLGRVVSSRRAEDVLNHAIRRLQTYHTRPVIERRGDRLHVGDANLLLFYRNRLEGYGLLDAPTLVRQRQEAP